VKELEPLVTELQENPEVLSIVLVGSGARGEMDDHSDLDLHVLVRGERPPDRLFYALERLVSVSFMDCDHQERIFTHPRAALWGIQTTRQAHLLYDPEGWYATLQTRARAFRWAQVEQSASLEVSQLLAGYAEEAHKILGGLECGLFEKAIYAAQGMWTGMADVCCLARGAFIETENRRWSTVRNAEPDKLWGELLWRVLGMNDELLATRGVAAAQLYVRSVALYGSHLTPEHALVAHKAAARVTRFLSIGQP